ncbi:MAG: general secretion pathway protein K [Candidatus Azotimanducaceae bacterium]|jgi:general secretion pathway protein K
MIGARRGRASQRGVALISVLLIVVIATILGVSMSREQNFAIIRARMFVEQSRVQQYALGGEELARQILHEDLIETGAKDTLVESWAGGDLRFEFEDGEVSLRIEDLQGRFNLNALGAQEGGNAVARERLVNLLSMQGIDVMFVDRIIDWVDANQNASPLGAEDFEYMGLAQPYRTSGQLLADVSELRLLLDMPPENIEQLLPLVASLPDPNTSINVNTAPAGVLQALVPDLSLEMAESMAENRLNNEGYDTVQAFLQDEALAGRNVTLQGLDVQSGYFQVTVLARYQERAGYLKSIIQRNAADGSLRVIYRDMMKPAPGTGLAALFDAAEGTNGETLDE